ncbi:Aminopeptidase N [Armadillidium vulgare]|nr:Aminopeptidase N [Armadillidium vulgare]
MVRISVETPFTFCTAITSEATVKQIAYALDIAPPILKYYDNYFEIVSPIPKQDIAAVPDFFYGAMENWGLVIYRNLEYFV